MKQPHVFGRLPDGTEVLAVGICSGAFSCEILTYGAALRTMIVPDRNGKPTDIVLGFDRLEDYLAHDAHFGGTIGRFANRIRGGRFTLGGVSYTLPCNDGGNHLHGGPMGFDRVPWEIERLEEHAVALSLHSADGDMGYPGAMDVRVTYSLQDASLAIRYDAVCDRDTLCSLTNHAYWNLSGHDAGDVLGQFLRLDAAQYTPSDPSLLPTGALAPVAGTPMDFTAPMPIGARIDSGFEALRLAGGYDHNYVIDRPDFAQACSAETGISLAVTTDRPGVQLYTGNFLGHTPSGKGGARYPKYGGFCLETQAFPDAPNQSAFPSAVLHAGERFESITTYRFGVMGKGGSE